MAALTRRAGAAGTAPGSKGVKAATLTPPHTATLPGSPNAFAVAWLRWRYSFPEQYARVIAEAARLGGAQ